MMAVTASVCAGCSSSPRQGDPQQSAPDVLPKINPALLKAHISFLGDDLLEGRGTGSKGYDIAAKDVAATFESLGLEPAGDNGS